MYKEKEFTKANAAGFTHYMLKWSGRDSLPKKNPKNVVFLLGPTARRRMQVKVEKNTRGVPPQLKKKKFRKYVVRSFRKGGKSNRRIFFHLLIKQLYWEKREGVAEKAI